MSKFFPGQRWMSETEPELGLGVILSVQDKKLEVEFRSVEVVRIYGLKTAPLKRVLFEAGDKITLRGGEDFEVESVTHSDEEQLLYYQGQGRAICETELEDALSFHDPFQKLFNRQTDSGALFQLRYNTLEHRRDYLSSSVRGLLGGRVALIPHQFFIVSQAVQRPWPRLLLADEVGLGKTIEAALIIHQMVATGRLRRVLILVPDSLAYQWFFELHRKFQLGFTVFNQETPPEGPDNPFCQSDRIVLSMGLLKGSQMARDLLGQAEFDMLVVDEAHRYTFSGETPSFEYSILEELAFKIPSLLLLTATPEQLGIEGHFHRLKLIDPDRFDNYDLFKKEVAEYSRAASLAKALVEKRELSREEETLATKWVSPLNVKKWKNGTLNHQERESLIQNLIDRHGTGRVFFRNTRAAMVKEYHFFPKRRLRAKALSVGASERKRFDAKALWLMEFLKENNHKVLLITHSKPQVIALEKFLRENVSGIKTALFHSGLSLMARDRQAAYFADPEGAQILLCTEIGSEGRNFEFAHHLILFDLPKKPDLLEQRIGRLDRIGQKSDIHIHVPYIKESLEEALFKIYHQGLGSFEQFSSVGTPVFHHFRDQLEELKEGELALEQVESLVDKMNSYARRLESQLEKGRDYLIELNSYRASEAKGVVEAIAKKDEDASLERYMTQVFDCFGVDTDELHRYALFARPNDNMFIPYFPGLPKEGLTLTYYRREALEREDYAFLTWDHPIVRGVCELILSDPMGNMTVAVRKSGGGKKIFVEAIFIVDCPAPPELDLERFLPSELIRILLDKEGEDFSEKWSKEVLDGKLEEAGPDMLEKVCRIPKTFFKNLLQVAEAKALARAQKMTQEAQEKILTEGKQELERLAELQKLNPSISQVEIDMGEELLKMRLNQMQKIRVCLEAVRLIL